MRTFKHHEYKLLRKTDFLRWKREGGSREGGVLRRYHVQQPEDYHKYNKLVGRITQLATKLKALPKDDPVRIRRTDDLLNKLFDMGLLSVKTNLEQAAKISVSSFCRRRLSVMLVRLKFAETMREAIALIEQGHIKVGPGVIKDPALIVTRAMEDFISWSDRSKIKRKVLTYNDKLDDYDLL
mmetsp:Transcript_5409/g.11405  ORF Transcript_5409/g.11405 Transcript_5409/m.11405 type:complete len:182 (+) Transcript_5409:66-611(+)